MTRLTLVRNIQSFKIGMIECFLAIILVGLTSNLNVNDMIRMWALQCQNSSSIADIMVINIWGPEAKPYFAGSSIKITRLFRAQS